MKNAYETKITSLEKELETRSVALEKKVVTSKSDDRQLLSDLFSRVSEQLKDI